MTQSFDPTEPHEIEEFDVVWATVDGVDLEATVYRPVAAGEGEVFGCLLDVHGGAWSYFDRRVDFNFDRRLAACGLVVLSIDFRLGPAHRYPAAVVDVNAATRHLRTRAAEYGGDPARVGSIGGSSGGHLVLLSALVPERPEFASAAGYADLGPWRGGEPSAAVDYVIALWPITDPLRRYEYLHTLPEDEALARILVDAHHGFFGSGDEGVARMLDASPERLVEAGKAQSLPPVLIQFPEEDRQITFEMQEAFVKAYEAAGGHVELEVLAGMAHSPANIPGPDADLCIESMKRFITARYRP